MNFPFEMSTVYLLSWVLMVFKKVLVSIPRFAFQYGSQSSIVWSGRIPEAEKVTILDNGREEQHVVVSALIGTVDKQEHTRRRRPWNRGFSTSALKGYESLVLRRALQLVEVLSSKNLKEAIDLTTWIQYFGYVAIIPSELDYTERCYLLATMR